MSKPMSRAKKHPQHPSKQLIARTTKILHDPKTRFVSLKQAVAQIEKKQERGRKQMWAIAALGAENPGIECWPIPGYRAVKVTVTRGWV